MGIPRNDEMEVVATAVTTDSCRRLPKRSFKQRIANVKNIAGDDQATLRVDQNSANITQFFEIFIYTITNDDPWLTVTVIATDSCHRLPKISLEEHVAYIKKHRQR